MTTALHTVQGWFAAHERGDLDAARRVVAEDLVVHADGDAIRGFDAFMAWYAARAERLGPTTYRVEDLLARDGRALAVLVISGGGRDWRQVAIYDVADGQIAEIRVLEEPAAPPRGEPRAGSILRRR